MQPSAVLLRQPLRRNSAVFWRGGGRAVVATVRNQGRGLGCVSLGKEKEISFLVFCFLLPILLNMACLLPMGKVKRPKHEKPGHRGFFSDEDIEALFNYMSVGSWK